MVLRWAGGIWVTYLQDFEARQQPEGFIKHKKNSPSFSKCTNVLLRFRSLGDVSGRLHRHQSPGAPRRPVSFQGRCVSSGC